MNTIAFMEAIERAEASGFRHFAAALRAELAKLITANRRARA